MPLGTEQKLIDELLPEYNILSIAGSSLGFKHSLETRELLSTLKQGSSLSEQMSPGWHRQPTGAKLNLVN